ncbi:MAG: tRNA (N(6)-L-threonylcarbamoyladenosine(37)-C(2))-methylthiotransferase MtaB [Nitrospirae bacterium]|nr:tRNA (N(6)-L-threonylcarbamoyladenosine(37)-C(2))-methylthiotransferase MtaB [Nitrospirota bacterium]
MKFCILTLGCKANQAESSYIENLLLQNANTQVTLNELPDVCIINTCSVTAKSDYQSRQLIRRAIRAGSKVFATGCYAEVNKGELRSISEDISIISNRDKLLHFLDSDVVSKPANAASLDKVLPVFNKSGRSRALLKIQDGCNSSCSYCIIPQTRGRSISRPVSEVVEEAKELELGGYNEVVLTGIHIGYYGLDLIPKVPLSDLVESILKGTSKIRVRLTSIEVNEITEALIELLKDERLCRHVHVPLQCGDDKILKDMNRGYRTAEFSRMLFNIHGIIDNAAIGTDVIVGYPGEDSESFDRTHGFLSGLPLTYLHVFPFSRRKGTRAFNLSAQVGEEDKKQRVLLLRRMSDVKKAEFMAKQVGRVLPAIVEKPVSASEEMSGGVVFYATTDNYLKVELEDGDNLRKPKERSLVNVQVTGLCNGLLKAAWYLRQ